MTKEQLTKEQPTKEPFKSLERLINKLKLEPESIKGFQFIEPVNLAISIYDTSNKKMASLLGSLSDPHFLDPYNRWQLARKVINPLYLVGSGFEGHLVGLTQKEILIKLVEYEDFIQRSAKIYCFQPELTNFIKNPNSPISVKFTQKMSTTFGALLAKARAQRSMLQIEGSQTNRRFQEKVYNRSTPIVVPNFDFDLSTRYLTIGVEKILQSKNPSSSIFSSDIKREFPYLSEIGRFGFPPLKLILSETTGSNLL